MSVATKVIRQVATGQISGQGLRKKAENVVASSTASVTRNAASSSGRKGPGQEVRE